ncbi:sulfopyruvate decarboxylase subunit alpha [bacterium]|nr:sulfopyruvate decarboxylase subunit alpha [bacterium]
MSPSLGVDRAVKLDQQAKSMNRNPISISQASKESPNVKLIEMPTPVVEADALKVENEILAFLKRQGFNFGVTFPCSKFKQLYQMLHNDQAIMTVPVTREEEGVGICAGAYLAGKKSFMLIQSSGLGNSFNAIASLLKTYKIPILILASYRGYYRENIPAQIPLGVALPRMLEALGVPSVRARTGIGSLSILSREYFHIVC